MAAYYSIPPWTLEKETTKRLSVMYSAMISNKARQRLENIEEYCTPKYEEKTRNKFLTSLQKIVNENYGEERMLSESELKDMFSSGRY